MKKRYNEEQIIGFLKEAEACIPVKELCRKHGFSDGSFYTWRAKFGGMDVPDAKRLKALEQENGRLKKLLADTMLDKEALEAALEKEKASVRAKVEHAFFYIKRMFGYNKVRYRGLEKNTNRLYLLAGFTNLLRAERYMAT